jgi:uncharacterized RDD family membrane protein YckC
MKEVGVGTRVINFIADTLLIALISYGLFKWHQFYVYYYGFYPYQYYLFFYVTLFIYYLLFELIFTRTPGKWLSLTRVRSINGKRPSWYQILLRSLLRLTIIDPFFIPFFNRTLHDQLSKTRVVEK